MDHYIAGKWGENTGERFESFDPATGDNLWSGRVGNDHEISHAVAAAREAFQKWSALSFAERLYYIEAFQNQLTVKKESLASIISKETGKPQWEALTEINAMIGKVAISVRAYDERTGERVQDTGQNKIQLRHKPHGVMAVLGPFNFPGHLPNGHIIPALIAGNTVVFKPSEYTPKVAEEIMHCWHEAKLPKGVLNLVQGDGSTGASLLANRDISGVCFTGSYSTGQKIHKAFAGRVNVILALELGGNNPLLVHRIKDHKAAAYQTIQSAYITAGQRCTCARRLIVPKGEEGDEFITVLVNMVKQIHVGHATQTPEPFMGPVICAATAQGLINKQDKLISLGAKLLCKMQLLQTGTGLVTPGLLDVTDIENRKDEEIFGPLLQIIRTDDFNHAIIEANNTSYGLSAGLLSDEHSCFEQFYEQVRAGIINWNRQLTGASGAVPFGGIGHSGNHRPGAYYAADYCAYPVASMFEHALSIPEKITPGIVLES